MPNSIPTAEIRVIAYRADSSSPWRASIEGGAQYTGTKKTADGMHLVFRYLATNFRPFRTYHPKAGREPAAISQQVTEASLHGTLHVIGPKIHISFPDGSSARRLFLPLCGGDAFITNGITLSPGEWRTLEVKADVGGISETNPFELAVDLKTLSPDPAGDGPPDEAGIIIEC